MHEKLVDLSVHVGELTRRGLGDIGYVTRATKMLAINALIEAAHAGDRGKGFAIVAEEVGRISDQIQTIAEKLGGDLNTSLDEMDQVSTTLVREARGQRLADMALGMIDIIDRNLYERSCDVRWWATDSAVVEACASESSEAHQFASKRLGVILDSYTVYFDLWIADLNGNVIANGRPERFNAIGTNVSREPWFTHALATQDGSEFAVDDITLQPTLGATVATYAAAVREGGRVNGKPIGVLGIFFDWQSQSQQVVDRVRLTDAEREISRCMLLDRNHRVIASTAAKGVLSETFRLDTSRGERGFYVSPDNQMISYALTPGYETYEGLGWYGVIAQQM